MSIVKFEPKYRALDFDDLYILRYMSDGAISSEAGYLLNLSPAAMSNRLRKINELFRRSIYKRDNTGFRNVKINDLGIDLAQIAITTLQEVKCFDERIT